MRAKPANIHDFVTENQKLIVFLEECQYVEDLLKNMELDINHIHEQIREEIVESVKAFCAFFIQNKDMRMETYVTDTLYQMYLELVTKFSI